MANPNYKFLAQELDVPEDIISNLCAIPTDGKTFFGEVPTVLQRLSSFNPTKKTSEVVVRAEAKKFITSNFTVAKTEEGISILAKDKNAFSAITVRQNNARGYGGPTYTVNVVDATENADNTAHRVNFASTSTYDEKFDLTEGYGCSKTQIASTTSTKLQQGALDTNAWLNTPNAAQQLFANKDETGLPYSLDTFSMQFADEDGLIMVSYSTDRPEYCMSQNMFKIKGVVSENFLSTGLTLKDATAIEAELSPLTSQDPTE